eukprot:gene30136-35113_t
MVLWLGRMLHKEWATEVFGVDVHSVADPSQLSVEPARESPMSKEWATEVFGVDVHSVADPSQLSVEPARESHMPKRVCAVLRTLRSKRRVHQQCFIIRQGSPLEVHVLPYFVEDRSQATASYSDYMMTMHQGAMK